MPATPATGLVRREFHAMGGRVELLVEAPPPAAGPVLDAAEREIRRLEALLSRFAPGSALRRLNDRGAIAGEPDLARVVEAALRARGRTGGRFDPTVHDALVAAGYDRDIARVAADDPRPAPPPPGRPQAPPGGDVTVDPLAGSVRLAPGVRLDLGGIAKGYAADRLCAILAAAGPALAGVGGDIAVTGARHDGRGWPVAVGDDGITLALSSGGVATSGRDRRRWRRAGRELHHVIDPATGRPARTDLLRATAVAGTAAEAEALATELLLLGASGARRHAERAGTPAVLVSEEGRVITTGAIR